MFKSKTKVKAKTSKSSTNSKNSSNSPLNSNKSSKLGSNSIISSKSSTNSKNPSKSPLNSYKSSKLGSNSIISSKSTNSTLKSPLNAELSLTNQAVNEREALENGEAEAVSMSDSTLSSMPKSAPEKSGLTAYSYKQLPRLVPWINWEEWKQVYRWLYSDHLDQIRSGLDRISAWRCRGKVPVAVNSTADLVEIKMKEVVEEQQPELGRSEEEKKLLYSMAIIRFVNGVVDVGQTSVYAQSISLIASKMGIPSNLVELRHEATHNLLPSLFVLRSAANQALKWLEDNYWTKQSDMIAEELNQVVSILNEYRKLQKAYLESNTNIKSLPDNIDVVLSRIKEYVSPNSINDSLIHILLQDGYLVPKRNKYKMYEALPMKIKDMWFLALKKFNYFWPHFVPTLIFRCVEESLALANKPTQKTVTLSTAGEVTFQEYRSSFLMLWALFLLKQTNSFQIDSVVPKLVQHCLDNFHPIISSHLLDQLVKSLPTETAKGVKLLCSLRTRQAALLDSSAAVKKKKGFKEDSLMSKTLKLLDLDELEEWTNQMKQQVNQDQTEGKWEICESSWNQTNIGFLPNGELPNLDLPVESFRLLPLKRYREEDFLGEEEDFMEEEQDENSEHHLRKRSRLIDGQIVEVEEGENVVMEEGENVVMEEANSTKLNIEEMQESIKLLFPMETLISFKFHSSSSTKQQE